jgi:hypothetical protein
MTIEKVLSNQIDSNHPKWKELDDFDRIAIISQQMGALGFSIELKKIFNSDEDMAKINCCMYYYFEKLKGNYFK